jgi:hypothetical protein
LPPEDDPEAAEAKFEPKEFELTGPELALAGAKLELDRRPPEPPVPTDFMLFRSEVNFPVAP